jgi:hypothetical protein
VAECIRLAGSDSEQVVVSIGLGEGKKGECL